jgi:O-antigen/teichoic acid export membrane protein
MLLSELLNRLKSSVFAKHALILVSGTAGAQLITIGTMPLLSRLYSPAEFGVWAIFLAVSSISATLITLRYETTILLPKSDEDSFRLVWLSAILTVIIGLSLVIIGWLLPDSLKKVLGVSVLGQYLPIAILAGIGMAFIAIGNNWLNRLCAYGKMSKIRLLQSIVAAIAALLLGYYGFSSGLLISQVIALLIAALLVAWLIKKTKPSCKLDKLTTLAKHYNHTPKYLLPTALLDTITLQLPVLLITAWFSSEMAGQFSMAWKILAIPLALIGAAIGQIFLQKFSTTWPDARAAKTLLYQTWLILAAIGFIPFILVLFYGEEIFIFILGENWAEAGRMASVIAPMLYAILISSPTSGTYLVLGLQKYTLFFGVLVFIYRPICLWIGLFNNNIIFGLILLTLIEIIQLVLYQVLAASNIRNRI